MKEKKERKINRRVDGSSKSSSKKTEGGSLIFLLNYLFFLPLHAAKYFTVSFFIFISWEERTYVYCNYQIWDSSCIQFLKTLMQSHLVYYSTLKDVLFGNVFDKFLLLLHYLLWYVKKNSPFFLFFIALSDLIVRKFTISHLQTYWNFYTDP